MKIVFMGTPQAAAVSLSRLIDEGHDVRGVYTQPDRPSGRGNKVAFSPVKELALSRHIAIRQPVKIKTAEAVEEFRAFDADIAVVVAYGRLLPETFLSSFSYGAINVHFSLLPKYRGAAPVNWAIVNGETETGVTTMKMDTGLDTGDVLLQKATTIEREENAIELMNKLADIGGDLLIETLANLNSIEPRRQSESNATFAPILKKGDGLINWNSDASEIVLRIRGFQPFPTTYTFYEGSRLTLWHANAIEGNGRANAGTILDASGESLVVSCGNASALSIREIQPEGKRRMSARDFINGAKMKVGDSFSAFREAGAA